MRELLTWIIIGVCVLTVGLACGQSGYNLYAFDKLSDQEREGLVQVLPKGLDYRLGGEEYEHITYDETFIQMLLRFVESAEGTLSLVAPHNYAGFAQVVDQLNASTEVTYKNEVWFEWDRWPAIRANLFEYIFRKQSYYRKLARKHIAEARQFEHDTGLTAIINVPLPKNQKYRWILIEFSQWTGPVSIHIYGDYDDGYQQRLNGWLSQLPFTDIRVHEMCGVDLRRWPNLKNSTIQAERHREILQLLRAYNITDIYYFTLVYNSHMGNWQNRPIYPRYYVEEDGRVITDELYNVFE